MAGESRFRGTRGPVLESTEKVTRSTKSVAVEPCLTITPRSPTRSPDSHLAKARRLVMCLSGYLWNQTLRLNGFPRKSSNDAGVFMWRRERQRLIFVFPMSGFGITFVRPFYNGLARAPGEDLKVCCPTGFGHPAATGPVSPCPVDVSKTDQHSWKRDTRQGEYADATPMDLKQPSQ